MRMRQFILRPLGRTVAAAIMWHPFVFDISQVSLSAVDVPMTFEEGIETSFLSSLVNANRFTLTASGFAKVDGNERIVSHPDVESGSFMEPAGVYGALPLDDLDAPTGASDPLNFTKTVSGDTIEYPGDHTLPDIFAGTGTGRGVVFTQSATGTGRFRAPNAKLTGVQAGDVVRMHALLRVETTAGGTIALRQNGQVAAINFTHDATGAITGTNASWASARVDFWPLPVLLGGEQFYYVWWDRVVTGTADIDFGVDFVDTVEGRKIHVCSLHWQRNPANAPAAVPITVPGAYGSDQITTGITSQVGFILHGVDSARSIAPSGIIAPPAIDVGQSYWPICTRVEVIHSTELADVGGIMTNPNLRFFSTPWQNPTNFVRRYGPCRIARDWLITAAGGRGCVNAQIGSVFIRRKDKMCQLGRLTTSRTYLTGSLTVDDTILLGLGGEYSKMWEQIDNGTTAANAFLFDAATGVYARRCLVMGTPLRLTRARKHFQADSTSSRQIYAGVFLPQINAGTINIDNSRFECLGRIQPIGVGAASTITLKSSNTMRNRIWSDPEFVGRGDYLSITANENLFGSVTNYRDHSLWQSTRQLQVNVNGGGWQDFDASGLTTDDLPRGYAATHTGVYDFVTNTLDTGAAFPAKTLTIREYETGSLTLPKIGRVGYQVHASRVSEAGKDYLAYPSEGDTFEMEGENISGDTIGVRFSFRTGNYSAGNVWNSYIGASNEGNPAQPSTATHADYQQFGRTNVTVRQLRSVGNVMIGGAQGPFITGTPGLPSNGSGYTDFEIRELLYIGDKSNGLRWDHSKTVPSTCLVADSLLVQAESDLPPRAANGEGVNLTAGAAGANQVMTWQNSFMLTGASSLTGLTTAEGGATYVGAPTKYEVPRVSNFDEYTTVADRTGILFFPESQRRANDTIILPETLAEIRALQLTALAISTTGVNWNANLATALGDHDQWDDVIADIEAKYYGAPDAYATVYADTAVGATLATGLTGAALDRYYGGDTGQFFTIEAGALKLAKAMTGIDRIQTLLTNAGELLVVDKVLTNAPVVEIAPEITASSITGTPEDGQVLTANATVTGSPTPTLAYQWQASGTNISGQTASTITLDAAGMGLTNGETISCEINATNTAGSDTAEPTIAFVADVQAELISAVNAGGGYSSVHDFTTATNPGTWTSEDLSANNRDFTQGTAGSQPGISGTLGGTFDGGDAVDQTISGGTFTVVMSLTKGDASTDATFVADNGATILVRYQSGSAISLGATVTVNGVSQSTRGDLYTALHTTGERLVKVAALDMTGDTALRIGGRPSTGLVGSIRRIVVLEHGTMGAGLAAAVALAETWVVAA